MFIRHLLRFGYFNPPTCYSPSEDQGMLDGSVGGDGKEDDSSDDLPPEKDEDQDPEESDKDGDDGEEGDDDKEEKEDKDKEDEEEDDDVDVDDKDKVLTSWTDIKAKYPDFAKEFPDVKNALFREQGFSEIFANPAEAREIAERVSTFDQLANDVVGNGDIASLLTTVKEQSKDSYEKIALSLLPYFQENEKELYYELAARPIKQLLRAAWAEGNGEKTDLGKAAAHIHKFFFKNLNFDEKVKSEGGLERGSGKTKREQELENRLSEIERGKENEFLSAVDDSYVKKMSTHIREGIDKDERLTEWSKSKITDDVLREIQRQLKKDGRYVGAVTSLIKQASNAGFTNDFKTRLINTALVRAKSLVPEVRKRIVAEALKAGRKGKEEGREREVKREVRRESRGTNHSSRSSSTPKKPLTDLDLLRS